MIFMESMGVGCSLPSIKKFDNQVQESTQVLPRLMSQDDFLSHLREILQSLLGPCRFVLYVSEDKTLRNFQTMAYGWSPSPLTHPSREVLSAWLKEGHMTCLSSKLSEEMKGMLAEIFNGAKGTESLVTWLDEDRECMICLCLQTEETAKSWYLGRLRTTL